MTTALIVVDVQNDFADPDGNLYVTGGHTIPAAVNEISYQYGDYVFFTKDYHPPITSHFAEHGGSWPDHCVEGTWGAEFHPELEVPQGAPVILKGTDAGEDGYSGFFGEIDGERVSTGLHQRLEDAEVDTVHIVGIALDVCVKDTALDAKRLGYETTVILGCTAAVTPEGAFDTIRAFENAGVYIL